MILSICIPSYNRGVRALHLVNELKKALDVYPNDIEIVVSNNGSVREIEEYKKISKIDNANIRYFEFEDNQQYVGNYNQVIRLSRGDFCLIISDEDSIDIDALGYYIRFLNNNPDIGMVRAKTSNNYAYQEKTEFFASGLEAVNAYFLTGTYISGAIYNRSVVTNELIDTLYNKYYLNSANRAYYWYPHLFVEALIILSNSIVKLPKLLVIEGSDSEDHEMNDEISICTYATYADRLEQAKGYFDFINDLKCSAGLIIKMSICIMERIFLLNSFFVETYKNQGIDHKNFFEIIGNGLKEIVISQKSELIIQHKDLLMEYLEALEKSYIDEYE